MTEPRTEYADGAPQKTLDGGRVEPVKCEYYDGCWGHAKWDVEVFMYDGYGWDYQNVLACQMCYDEEFELKFKDPDERASRLKPGERWTDD